MSDFHGHRANTLSVREAAMRAGNRMASGEAQLWLLLFIGCMLPAIVNGGPLVFGDTHGYLIAARDFRPNFERIFGYAAFLRVAGGLVSLWLPALLQAAIAAFLATRLLSLEAKAWPPGWRPLLLAAFVTVLLAGHLPWLAGFLMPDLFTGLLVLALLLLGEHWPRLRRWERWSIAAFLAGAASTHMTHPYLLLGAAALAAGVALLPPARPVAAAAWRTGGLALMAALLALSALVAANLVTYRQATPFMGNPVFFFARLQADMDAPRILRPRCEAGARDAICGVLDRLEAGRMGVDEFLWSRHLDPNGRSPIPELGWFNGFYAEARKLNPILLREGWRDWLSASTMRALQQMGRFRLGDGMSPLSARLLLSGLPKVGMPDIATSLADTRQARGTLHRHMPRLVADGLAAMGLIRMVGLFAVGLALHRPELWWPALLFLSIWIGNAMLIGLGGTVHDRYGARLAWAAPLLAGLLAIRAAIPHREPGPAETPGAGR